MNICEVCENQYHKAFQIIMGGRTHTFDSFECAIHALAPRCHHCGCRIIGHGVEDKNVIYCGAHCARQEGHINLRDQGLSALEDLN